MKDFFRHFIYRRLIPNQDSLVEASAYVLVGFGIFLGIACYSYDAADYSTLFIRPDHIHNLGGPFGARIAHFILQGIGLVGILLPAFLVLWGSLAILGFVTHPSFKRIIGLFILIFGLPPIVQIYLDAGDYQEPSFGFGGSFGQLVAGVFKKNVGSYGAMLFLCVILLVMLVLSGNLNLSQIGPSTKKFLKNTIKWTKKFFAAQWADIPKEEELIREALAKVAIASAQKKGEIDPHMNVDDILGSRSTGKSKRKSPSDDGGTVGLSAEGASLDSFEGTEGLNFYFEGTSKKSQLPGPEMFTRSEAVVPKKEQFEKLAKKLSLQLAQFKVEGKVVNITEGPVVTTCEFEPAPGTKISKITGLSEDLARMLEAKSLRILAPIPGKNTVGFEVPNSKRRNIGFADLIESKVYKSSKMALPIAMGVDAFGTVVIEDLAKMPHLLVAGSTGSGKSVFMNTLIASLICRHGAKSLRFIMVDPKMVELAAYNKLPHMATPVITDPTKDAKSKLDALVLEMENRFRRMGMVGARNIEGFNEVIKEKKKSAFENFDAPWEPMPFIVLIIDELADMMMVLGKEAEIPITRLAQKARAAGIHLVIATQRPSAEVVTGLIKANFPTRVAFRVLSGLDSRTILDASGAETLLGQGDMLYLNAAGLRRMHGAYLSDKEVAGMVKVAAT